MKIGIYANKYKDKDFTVTNKLISLLEDKKIEYALFNNYLGTGVKTLDLEELARFSDAIIVLGGDGTILQVINECANNNVLVAGINLGHLGFLLDFDENDLEKLVDCIISKRYTVEKRALLNVEINGKNFVALNDAVISKGENTRLINISAKVDGKLLDDYFCDGIIVSTSTGSTAYSMSVGGPILAPNVEGFIINPISSHSLHSRPVVVSDKSTVELECEMLSNDCQLVIDGELYCKIKNNEKLVINKSNKNASFIRDDYNFYDILLRKLNKWGVTESRRNNDEKH